MTASLTTKEVATHLLAEELYSKEEIFELFGFVPEEDNVIAHKIKIEEVASNLLEEKLYDKEEILELFGFVPEADNKINDINDNNVSFHKFDFDMAYNNLVSRFKTLQDTLKEAQNMVEKEKKVLTFSTPTPMVTAEDLMENDDNKEERLKILKLYQYITCNLTLKETFKNFRGMMSIEKYIYTCCEKYVKDFAITKHNCDTFRNLLYLENEIDNHLYGEFKPQKEYEFPEKLAKMSQVISDHPDIAKKLLAPEESQEMFEARLIPLLIQHLSPIDRSEWLQKDQEFQILQEAERALEKSSSLKNKL